MKFLLVEDDPNDVYFVKKEFQSAPVNVSLIHVGDGRESIRYLLGEGEYEDRQKHPLPNVILLDLKMPGLDGFQFLKWLRTESPGDLHLLPSIIMSSSAVQKDIKRAYALGANLYMCKPVNWDVFKERIRLLGVFWAMHIEVPEIPALGLLDKTTPPTGNAQLA